MRLLFALGLLALALPGCAGAATSSSPEGSEASLHREGDELAFVWREAAVVPGAYRVVEREGVLRTLEVLQDGTGRLGVEFLRQAVSLNGRDLSLSAPAAEIRFLAGSRGGVSGSMSVLGEARAGETLVAMLLPFAWPPVHEWPAPTAAEQTVALSVGGADGVVEYRRRAGAPVGVSWISLGGDVRIRDQSSSDTAHARRARVGVLLGHAGGLETSARIAMSLVETDARAVTEAEMRIGEGVALPAAESGSLLVCEEAVRVLRARLDAEPLPPFVLNRPIDDALISAVTEEAAGPGVLLDLRSSASAAPLDVLFEDLDEPTPDRDVAALSARLTTHIEATERAMQITAALIGMPDPDPRSPVYLLLDADALASRALSLGAALRRLSREPRLVLRRPATGPREGMLRGSLWPMAERLGERATECAFVAGAVAELASRDVVAAPGWVRAVVAGGVGTCGCDPVMSDELAREALRWSDVSLQSWGYATLESREVGAGATVAGVFVVPPAPSE